MGSEYLIERRKSGTDAGEEQALVRYAPSIQSTGARGPRELHVLIPSESPARKLKLSDAARLLLDDKKETESLNELLKKETIPTVFSEFREVKSAPQRR
jgi:hypothetical protein